MTHRILRLPAVKESTGLSRSTLYLRIANGVFTHPVSLGGRAVGWPADEVVALNAARIAGKSDADIRELVAPRWKRPARLWRRTDNAMRKRRPNHRLVKIHRNYTVEEAARLLGTHKNTVRAWVRAGLTTCDSNRPILILGRDLAHFSRPAGLKNKQPCSREKSTACDAVRQSDLPGTWPNTPRSRRRSGIWRASARTAEG